MKQFLNVSCLVSFEKLVVISLITRRQFSVRKRDLTQSFKFSRPPFKLGLSILPTF